MTNRDFKHVWIIRHAKSAHPTGISDLERPLNDRGEQDGRVMAHQLELAEHPPTTFLVSHSVRTRRTAELINEGLGAKIELVPGLYSAGCSDVETLLSKLLDDTASVGIVTHLPTIDYCLRHSENSEEVQFFPTLGVCCLEYVGSWQKFGFQSTKVLSFMVPRSFR